jgi:hypothetical protein
MGLRRKRKDEVVCHCEGYPFPNRYGGGLCGGNPHRYRLLKRRHYTRDGVCSDCDKYAYEKWEEYHLFSDVNDKYLRRVSECCGAHFLGDVLIRGELDHYSF